MLKRFEISAFNAMQQTQVIEHFTTVFTNSEGIEEGKSIGVLVTNLIQKTSPQDLVGFVAKLNQDIIGSIFFSRFTMPDNLNAFILSPVAIATQYQGLGVGQRLIQHGLKELEGSGVDVAITYGDPAFYAKVGFKEISEGLIKAPHKLSQPIGWLAQSLNGQSIPSMTGDTHCVEALDDPQYW